MFACLALGVVFLAGACGGKEVFVGEPTGTIAFTSDRDGNGEIYTMNGDGSEQVNISHDESEDIEPSWSPDGSRLAFSSFRTGPANIFVMDADGGGLEQLTENPAVEGGVRWSPDGGQIAFYTFRQERSGFLWVMNLDGSDLRPLLQDLVPGPDTACAGGFPGGWFPDGERILFRGSQGGAESALQICSVTLDSSEIEIILSEATFLSYYPSLSPDGRKIAFTTDRDGNFEVYVMNAGGGGLRRLTDDPGLDEYPAWSPDGQWIAFHSDRDGDFDIYIVRPDGTDLRRLTDNDSSDQQPSWSAR